MWIEHNHKKGENTANLSINDGFSAIDLHLKYKDHNTSKAS